MSEHVPCEHCEEVRQEEEDRIFGEALREGLKMEKGTLGRMAADLYMDDLFRPSVLELFGDKDVKVKFRFWSDLDG